MIITIIIDFHNKFYDLIFLSMNFGFIFDPYFVLHISTAVTNLIIPFCACFIDDGQRNITKYMGHSWALLALPNLICFYIIIIIGSKIYVYICFNFLIIKIIKLYILFTKNRYFAFRQKFMLIAWNDYYYYYFQAVPMFPSHLLIVVRKQAQNK